MFPQWDSNQGPLAYQSSVLSIRPWSLMKIWVIFHLYISIWWKIQLTLKKTTASQTHFGFTNIGSNMHHFCATAIWNPKISNETPCRQWRVESFPPFLNISFLIKNTMVESLPPPSKQIVLDHRQWRVESFPPFLNISL